MHRVQRMLSFAYQRDWVLVVPVRLFSLIMRGYVPHLPGPNPDELLYVYPAEKPRVGDPLSGATFQIAGRSLPAGLTGYEGALPRLCSLAHVETY